MQSEDYKERFKAEYFQLKTRGEKLREMLVEYEADILPFTPKCSIELLERQYKVMSEYMLILEIRAKIEGVKL